MSTLYEMTNAFEMLWDMIDDPDYDEDAILDTLEGIDGEIEDKKLKTRRTVMRW